MNNPKPNNCNTCLDLIGAGFVISHKTHTLAEVTEWMRGRWEIEEVQFIRTCLHLGYTKKVFTELVKRHSRHPIAFQHGKRIYYN